MHFLGAALLVIDHIAHVRHGGDDIHVELTVKSLLHDFHVEQAQETATESESESYG